MRKLLNVSVAMLIWGSHAFASLPPAGSPAELQQISNWVARLNRDNPGLAVRVRVRLDLEPNVRAVQGDLRKLEQEIMGRVQLNPGELQTLACPKLICGGQ